MKSEYFELNNWSKPLYPPAAKEFLWRSMTNQPPQFVLITNDNDVRLPDTSLDVFRIDFDEMIIPELWAWPVKGVPCAIVGGSFERRLRDICLEYQCPIVECYQLEFGELYGPQVYPEGVAA